MKNQRIKINMDRTPLDSRKIAEMQDFSRVMKGYTAATLPFYKKWWFWGGAGTAIVGLAIVAATAFNYKEPQAEQVTKRAPAITPAAPEPGVSEALIKPAFKGFNVGFTTFIVNSGEAKTLEMPSGTKIQVPACPFKFTDGSEVEGKVEIRFREMNDAVDFAVSGIPMEYDSAGQKRLFESAGMCEIQGSKEGRAVLVNPDCPITIEQRTVRRGGRFNMYYLDTAARNWQFIGKPNWNEPVTESFGVTKVDLMNNFSTGENQTADNSNHVQTPLDAEIEELKKNAPKPPRQYNAQKYNFNILADAGDYPELQEFTGLIFEVDSLDRNFKPAVYNYTWNKATLEETNCKCGKMKLTLERASTYMETFVAPKSDKAQVQKEWTTEKVRLHWLGRVFRSIGNLFRSKENKRPMFNIISKEVKDKKKGKGKRMKDIPVDDSDLGQPNHDTLKAPTSVRLVPVENNQYVPLKFNLRNTDKMVIEVYPVLTGKDYYKAMQEYKERLARHNQLLADKIAALEKMQREAAELARQQREAWQRQQASFANGNQHDDWIRNSFAADKFGIYNCDNPILLGGETVRLDFLDKNGEGQEVESAYVVIKNRNALITNYYNNCCDNTLRYNTTDNNLLFVVLPGDYVSVVEKSDFEGFKEGKNNKVVLKISDKPITSTDELKTFLGVTKPIDLLQ